MLIVEYKANDGCSFRDAEVIGTVRTDWKEAQRQAHFKSLCQNTLGDGTYRRTVASELYISALRVLVARGEVDHKKVKIVFIRSRDDHVEISIDRHGQLSTWPKGFCDTVFKKLLDSVDGA